MKSKFKTLSNRFKKLSHYPPTNSSTLSIPPTQPVVAGTAIGPTTPHGNSSHNALDSLAAPNLESPKQTLGQARQGQAAASSRSPTPTQAISQSAAWTGLEKFLRSVPVSENRMVHDELRNELDDILNRLCEYFGGDIPPVMTPSIVNLVRGIEQEIIFVIRKQQRTKIETLVGSTRDVDEIAECQDRVRRLLERLELNANLSMWKTVDEIATEARLKSLPVAPEAKHRSAESSSLGRVECTTNTRTKVLNDLNDWADAENSEEIYWLNGMAGTGKTTVAYSFCEDLRKRHRLAASFFCSRQLPSCRNFNRIVPTISYQLALFSRPFRHALSEALEDLDVHNQPLSEQFDYLIASPLHTIQHTLPGNLVVVIDALDECESADGMAMILDVILSRAQELPVKFFVASRPDAMILDRMRKSAGGPVPAELRLHELDHSVVQGDIKLYLSNKLRSHIEISEDDLETLAARAGALFIYAATVVRYIIGNDTLRSPRRLQDVLKSQRGNASSNSSNKEIDALYTTILESAINNPKLDDIERDETRLVLHTVICAQEPPSLDILAGLLKLDRDTSVRPALRLLLSVLQLSDKTTVVNTLHQSFSEYILDERRSALFYCDAKTHHGLITQLCFEQTSVCSPFNICNLDSSYLLDEEVEDMGRRIKEYIPEELLYACRYWAAHLKLANDSDKLAATMFGFLSERVLVWMEIMNLNNCIHEAARAIYEAREWSYVSRTRELEQLLIAIQLAKQPEAVHRLLSDAWEFVSSFSSSQVNLSTPHIYVSHLSFWSKEAPMAKYYQLQGPSIISNTSTAMSIRKIAPVAIFNTGGEVNCLRYSHSGLTIASSSRDDNMVHIWDARNGRPAGKPLEGHIEAATCLAYSPDDAYIVSGSVDCTVRIWDTRTGKEIGRPLEGHTKYILTVAYSPDGTRVASGSKDKTVRVWDARTGKAIGEALQRHTSGVMSVVYSPDGTCLASSSDDKTICIWDVSRDYALRQLLHGHNDCVYSIAYSPDGTYIVSGSGDRTIRIWDANTGDTVNYLLWGHTLAITAVTYSLDGTRIFSGSLDRTVRVWYAHKRNALGQALEGHDQWVSSIAASPNGAYIASGSNDGTIRIWPIQSNTATARTPKGHFDAVLSVTYSSDNTRIVSSSADKTVRAWDAATGRATPRPIGTHVQTVYSAACSPDGVHVASGSGDGTICIWDVRTNWRIGEPLRGHTGSVCSVAYSPTGDYVLSGSSDKTISIWNIRTGGLVGQPLEGHESAVRSVAYSSDGAFIASGSDDFTIRIWDTLTGKTLGQPLEGHTDKVLSVAFSPDGLYVVSGSDDETVRIWNSDGSKATGQVLHGHTGPVLAVAYSPCGAYIASGSEDMTVRIWDATTGNSIGEPLEGHTSWISSVGYSPDGAYIVTGSYDKTIRVWRPPTGPQSNRADPHSLGNVNHTKMHICNSGCQLGGPHQTWQIDERGWVVTKDNKKLVWVPPELRKVLLCPMSMFWISRRGFLKLDFNSDGSNKVGENWADYFRPRTSI
ncbi:Vegetative incompatibility protein HET-E-1 [Ceratobasidium sp. AG-Ba]|nr:Vegetative incompatibility protein HET-E-1 [Ceratobasidium sp. AG-Ba]